MGISFPFGEDEVELERPLCGQNLRHSKEKVKPQRSRINLHFNKGRDYLEANLIVAVRVAMNRDSVRMVHSSIIAVARGSDIIWSGYRPSSAGQRVLDPEGIGYRGSGPRPDLRSLRTTSHPEGVKYHQSI